MSPSSRHEIESAARRVKVADLYIHGSTQPEIAALMKVDQSTISRDLRALRQQWQEQALYSISRWKAEQLARIDMLEREYWKSWERSQHDIEVNTLEQKGVLVNGQVEGGEVKKSVRREGQVGNAAYLSGIQWCIQKRCEILGLDAPKDLNLGTAQGHSLTVKILRGVSMDDL